MGMGRMSPGTVGDGDEYQRGRMGWEQNSTNIHPHAALYYALARLGHSLTFVIFSGGK